jgi:hypothetical protein
MTTELAALKLNGHYITANIIEQITMDSTRPALKQYILEKNDWSDATFQEVDWTAIRTYLSRLSISKRVKVIKLMHNWQNTGRQKGLFRMNTDLTAEDMATTALLEKCPMGCGEYEAPLHYIHCKCNPHSAEMTRGLEGIRKWLRSNETAPALTSVLMRMLRLYAASDLDALDEWDFTNEPNAEGLHQLVNSQARIGWDNLFKGRISNEWCKLQAVHLRITENPDKPRPAYRTAAYWASCLIQQIVYFTLNTWQIRNDKLHEDKVESERTQRRKEVLRDMARWYEEASTSRQEFRTHTLFKMPLLQRKTHSTPMIESWLSTVKEQYDYLERARNEAEHEESVSQARRDRIYALAGGRRTAPGRIGRRDSGARRGRR